MMTVMTRLKKVKVNRGELLGERARPGRPGTGARPLDLDASTSNSRRADFMNA